MILLNLVTNNFLLLMITYKALQIIAYTKKKERNLV